jgi:FAD/FMN-containing dehydrogenase/ferredoxin
VACAPEGIDLKLLDLLMHPMKAARRYSPLQESLTEGQENELLWMFNRVREGEHRAAVRDERTYASNDPVVCEAYAEDSVSYPGAVDRLVKRQPGAVVLPTSESELLELIRFAQNNNVPVVPRGGGTSVHGGSVPVEGGVVADMRGFDDVLEVDEDDGTVRVRAGMTWGDLDDKLAEHGLRARAEPIEAPYSTIGGSLAMGKAGFGSYVYGSIRDNVVEAEVLGTDLEVHTRRGDELDLVDGCQGATGFVTEVEMRVQERSELTPTGAAFDSIAEVERYVGGLPHDGIEHVHVLGPRHVDLKMEPEMSRALPKDSYVVIHAIDDDREELVPDLQARVDTLDGEWVEASDARWEWERRHQQRNFQRYGPSLLVAKAKCPRERLTEAWQAGMDAVEAREWSMWAIASGPDEFTLVLNVLGDRRLPGWPLAWGNRLAWLDAVKGEGGSAAAPGLLTPGEANDVLGKARVKRLSTWKKDNDPEDVMNPGKVLPARVKGVPVLPTSAAVVPGNMMLKASRGQYDHRRGSSLEPSNRALKTVYGRRLSKRLGELADEVQRCSRLGHTNRTGELHRGISFDAERPRSIVRAGRFDTQLPRGVISCARAILEGTEPTEQMVSHVLSLPAVPTYETHSQNATPILATIEAVREAGQAAAGLDPRGPDVVDRLAETDNVFGEDPEGRGEWVPGAAPSGVDTTTLLVAGDEAAYQRTEDALNVFNTFTNAGFGFTTLGEDEVHPGTIPYRLGAFDAAADQVAQLASEAEDLLDGVRPSTLVTISSEDADVLRRRLDDLVADTDHEGWSPRVLTATEVTASLAKAGRLRFEGQGDEDTDEAGDEEADADEEDPSDEPDTGDGEEAPGEAGDDAEEPEEGEDGEDEEAEEGFETIEAHVLHSPFATDNERAALEDLVGSLPEVEAEVAEVGDTLIPDRAYALTHEDQTEALTSKAKTELPSSVIVGCSDLAAVLDDAGVDVHLVHDLVAERMQMQEGGVDLADVDVGGEEEFQEFDIPDDAHRVELVKQNAAIPVYEDESILDAAERHGFDDLPYDCRAGSCVSCSAKWEGAAPDQSEGQVLSDEEQEEYVLTCIAKPEGDVKIWSGEQP